MTAYCARQGTRSAVAVVDRTRWRTRNVAGVHPIVPLGTPYA
jgi:hypothetical protein